MRARRESRLRAFAAKLRGFLSSQPRDDGFDDEIQEHVRLLADRFVAQGMSREEAALSRATAVRQHHPVAGGPQSTADAALGRGVGARPAIRIAHAVEEAPDSP